MSGSIKFDTHDKFLGAVSAIQESKQTESIIERAIGRAILDRLAGKSTSLTQAYANLGGKDPIAKHMFDSLNETFSRLDLGRAKATAQTAVMSAARPTGGGGQASKSSVRADNPVFNVNDTALHTLAELGGPEFKAEFNVR